MLAEDWRQDFNAYRPNRVLGMMTLQAFATGWITAHTAAARQQRTPRGIRPRSVRDRSPYLQEPTIHQPIPEVVL